MSNLHKLLVAAALIIPATPTFADVISDWNDKAVTFLTAKTLPPPQAERTMAMVNVAMFDTVNAVERRYRPYLAEPQASPDLPKEAAAAAAAGTVLAGLYAPPAGDFAAQVTSYLQGIPDGEGKLRAVALGQAVATSVLAARAGDGSEAPDSYRPRTQAGVWIPTYDGSGVDVAEGEAVRHSKSVAFSAQASGGADKRAMGDGLQRNQDSRCPQQQQAIAAADRSCLRCRPAGRRGGGAEDRRH